MVRRGVRWWQIPAVGMAFVALGAPAPAAAQAVDLGGYERCEGSQADGGNHLEVLGDPVPAGVPADVAVLGEAERPGSEHVAAYDIDLALEADGDALVEERITYDFGGLQRRGIFRTIVTHQRCDEHHDRVYRVRDVAVDSPSGAPDDLLVEAMEPDVGAAGVSIRIGDPDTRITGVHEYIIRYRLEAVATPFVDHVELYWNVIGEGWDVPIADARVRVTAPTGPLRVDCFVGSTGSTERCDAMAVDGDGATFAQRLLRDGEGMTVAVAYPSEAFDLGPPVLHERWSLGRAFTPSPPVVAGAVTLGVLAVGAVLLLTYEKGRDRQLAGSPVDVAFAPAGVEGEPVPIGRRFDGPVEFAPPDRLRPAQLGLVIDEKVGPTEVSATIVDLAVRGYLRIVEEGEGRRTDYILERLRDDHGDLLVYEMQLVDSLFGPGSAAGTTRRLSDLDQVFKAKLDAVCNQVYDDGLERGWFSGRPDKVRTTWRLLGLAAVLVSALVIVGLAAFTHAALLGVPLLVASVVMVALAGRFPRRTPAGTGVLRRARGFQHFIEDSEAPRARWAEQRSIFTDYLPYAIVFGCADRWARTFAPLGAEATAAVSGWYVGSQPFSVDGLAASTSRFASAAASSLSSVPPSSSSSGSSGFSGGGGSSGGGGGGGGGGSW